MFWVLACTRFVEPGEVEQDQERLLEGTWSRERILDQTPFTERIDWTMAIGFDLVDDEPLFGFGMTDLLGTTSTNWIQGHVYRRTSTGIDSVLDVNGTRYVDVATAPDGRICATYYGNGLLQVACDEVVVLSEIQPASTPNLAFDADGGMHLAWRASLSSTDIVLRYRGPDGVITDVVALPNPSSVAWNAFDLAVSPDGVPYIGQMQPTPGLWSKDAAGTWFRTELGHGSTEREQISVAVSESGAVAVA
jgi:hypothetical protein